jgi:hypothetical protein
MTRQSTVYPRLFYCLAALVMVFVAGLSRAQDVPTLSLNTPMKVTLVAGGVKLTYHADAVQIVNVVARSLEGPGKVDTTLTVLDAISQRVKGGFDDDHSTPREGLSERDSLIPDLRLPAPGDYTIWLNSFNGVDTGEVEVTVETADLFHEQSRTDGNAEVITATLPAGERYLHPMTLSTSQIVTLTVRDMSGTLDPLLTVRDSSGKIAAQNDDHADKSDTTLDTLDAQIAHLTLPAGTYTLEVIDFAGAAGTFELRIARS